MEQVEKEKLSQLLFRNLQQVLMQQTHARIENSEEKPQEENRIQVAKKKPSILKRKKLPPTKLFSNVDLKHVININDICFVNEDSLRHPDSSEQTLLKTLYHYKMISKVTLNNSFINIQLKKNEGNYLPPEYFFERLRSFGDQKLANIASHLENIHMQMGLMKAACPVKNKSFAKDSEETLLQSFLEQMQGKKYFLYFSEITPEKTNLKNVIFSLPLLKALGCNIKNIAMDFLRYKHVFFEVFTAKNYKTFIQKCLENYAKISTQLMLHPNMSEGQKKELTSIFFDEEVIRRKQGPEGIYEQVSRARVVWYSPHPSICCFEILDIDEAEGFKIPQRRKIFHFEETKPEEEIQELKKIGIEIPMLQIEDQSPRKFIECGPQDTNCKNHSGQNKSYLNDFSGNIINQLKIQIPSECQLAIGSNQNHKGERPLELNNIS